MKHLILLLALALPAAAQLTNQTLNGVTNATINGKLDDDAAATRTALGLGTAATGYLPSNFSLELDGVNYVADAAGSVASDITIQHVVSGTGSTVISVTCPARAIVVTAGSAATSTTVAAAVNANAPASALITATALGYGTDLFKATAQTALRDPVSPFGGPNNVVQLNSQGNLQLQDGTISGDGLASGPGNINLQNGARLWMLNAANSSGGSMFYNATHGGDGGEVQFNSDHRIALCMGWYGALQIGLATDASTNKQYAYMQSRGPATASITSTNSLPLYFQPLRWNGSSAVVTQSPSIQGVADGTTGDAFLDFSAVGAQPNGYGADGSRTLNMRLSKDGVWEAGKAPTFDTLTASSNIFTQTCSIYKAVQNAKITLGATNTLAISGAAAGMRGVIYVTQDSAGSRTLTLPSEASTTATWVLSTTAGTTDRLMWEFDGNYYFFSMVKGYELPLDSDASAFITRQGTTDSTEKAAINTLVRSLKTASLWTKFYAIYPFIGATGTAQSKNLISDTYNITWSGTGHTFASASGVTGAVGTSAYGNTGINFSTLSTLNNASGYVYVRTAAPTEAGYWFGATDGVGRFGIKTSTTYNYVEGPMNNGGGIISSLATFKGHHASSRSDSSNYLTRYSGTYSSGTGASTAGPNQSVFLLARNNNGSPAGYSNVNLGMAAFGNSMTSGEWATFETIVTAYQTTLGRANP